jgi:tRNA-Thr(GGU) m(6)t(6)A37 methyltransferase TsaA
LFPSLTLKPIGYLRTGHQLKFHAGHQPTEAAEQRHEVELLEGCGYEQALQDLAGIERVWLIWWFHRNESWRPLVLPPRGPSRRRGVFATRSPHRPNPLGLSAVRLLGINGRSLVLGPCDLLDGTPILDVKPYVPSYDAFGSSSAGWIDEMESELAAPPSFTVGFADFAREQIQWLKEAWQIDFTARLVELLSRDPAPHRTRRIRKRNARELEIGCGAWRALFVVSGTAVSVQTIEAAYPMKFLARADYKDVPDREAQLAFLARWPVMV